MVLVEGGQRIRGIIRENIRIISLRANLLKKDATLEEIRAIHSYMENSKP